jgi:hypothetical protein
MTPEMFYPIGALILFIALGVGLVMNMTRDKRKDAITEAATREEYEHPKRYQRTRTQFKKAADRIDTEDRTA